MKKCGHDTDTIVQGCRLCELFAENDSYRASVKRGENRKIITERIQRKRCSHLGDEISGVERDRLGLTHLKVWRECEKGRGPQCQCNAACGPSCPDYEASETETMTISQNVDYPSVGVSIGHYGFPGIIELQAKIIRENCGNIPILVSDDHTEEAGDDGLNKKMRLLDICEKYSLIYRDSGPNRIGHAGGDLGSYWHGLHYANGHGIEYWLKLSQRLVIDRPMYVQKCALMMKNKGHHTMSQTHKNRGRFFFAMRTEFALLEVRRWFRPDILNNLQPRPLGRAAEDIVHGCVKLLGGAIMATPLFTAERSKKHAGVVWYEQPNSMEEYQLLADKYNVTLGNEFHCGGSIHSPNFKWGAIMLPMSYLLILSKLLPCLC